MKIINEKGRLFGIINPVDLLALLTVVLIIAGVSWKLFGSSVAETVAPEVEMVSVMRVRGAYETLAAEFTKSDPRIVSGNAYVSGAEITKVWTIPYEVQVPTADGHIESAIDPVKIDIMFEITARVSKDTPNPKIGNQEVRAGRTYIVKTQTCEIAAVIETVEIGS